MKPNKKIALITGANRGIGLEASKQLAQKGFRVIMTSRDEHKGKPLAEKFRSQGLDIDYHPLDISQPESIATIRKFLDAQYGKLDVLVNNAGIMVDKESSSHPIEKISAKILEERLETMEKALRTNTLGPLLLSYALAPLIKNAGGGRIINVSSTMGQLSSMNSGWPSYRVSKVALNAVTVLLADELRADRIAVNSIHPGWVQTDMGGRGASVPVEEGPKDIIWLATRDGMDPTGSFIHNHKVIEW